MDRSGVTWWDEHRQVRERLMVMSLNGQNGDDKQVRRGWWGDYGQVGRG